MTFSCFWIRRAPGSFLPFVLLFLDYFFIFIRGFHFPFLLFFCVIYRLAAGGEKTVGNWAFFLFLIYIFVLEEREERYSSLWRKIVKKVGWGEEWGGKGDVYLIFFIYIGKISQTNTFLSASFLSKFSHFSHFGFSPFFSFPLHSLFFFPLLFIFYFD